MLLMCLQQQIQEVFKNQQEQINMQLLQQKNAGMVSQEVTLVLLFLSAYNCFISTLIFIMEQEDHLFCITRNIKMWFV